jgi:hypothetical protein
MSARTLRALLLAGLTLLVSAAVVRAEVIQEKNLRLTVSGDLSPHSLPRAGGAAVAVSVGGRIATTDGSLPPLLESLRIELNRHGHIDYAGLPVCPFDRIHPASSARALAACRSSLVGKGRFWANIVLSGQKPYPSQGKLLVFNGRRHGRPVLLGQIYSPRPFATSFVIVFTLQRAAHGTYGTVLTAALPKALGNWGYLTAIEMELGRSFSYRGTRHSYVSAACPAPAGFPGASFPLARTSFRFADGTEMRATLTRDCTVRRGNDDLRRSQLGHAP